MKLRKSLLQICALLLATVTLAPSQTLDGLKLIAHYPLKDSANDTLGNFGPMSLINTPFQEGGIYCNGNYNGADSDSCDASTPFFDTLSMQKFAVSARFKVTTDYPQLKPILVGGPSWRWMVISLDPNRIIRLGLNGLMYGPDAKNIVCSKNVWHTVTATYDSVRTQALLYLDGVLADSISMPLDHGNDKIFSITHGGVGATFEGILADIKIYSEDKGAAVRNDALAAPRAFHLQQNYPNPFNPTATIEFAIQKPGDYELALYSTNGRKVRTLLSENFAVRTYSFIFTASNLPSGVYICKLQGEGESQVRRLVLLK